MNDWLESRLRKLLLHAGLRFDVGDEIGLFGGDGEGFDWVNERRTFERDGRIYDYSGLQRSSERWIMRLRPLGERLFNNSFVVRENDPFERYFRELETLTSLWNQGLVASCPDIRFTMRLLYIDQVPGLIREHVPGLENLAALYQRLPKEEHEPLVRRTGRLLRKIHTHRVHGNLWPGNIVVDRKGQPYVDHASFMVNPAMPAAVARAKDIKHTYFTTLHRTDLSNGRVAEYLLDAYHFNGGGVKEALHDDATKNAHRLRHHGMLPGERLFTGTVWGVWNELELCTAYRALVQATAP